jgi:transposase
VPDVPGVSSAEELSALPHAELARLLAGAYRVIAEQSALVARLQARVEQLERQAGKDSSNSSRPPSSDSPYKKKPRDRSLRERGRRRPGKQPGEPGTTLRLVDDPGERLVFSPACCRGCGAGLAGEPVWAQRRHQVTDIAPPPPPVVTEYVAQAKACPGCGTVSEGLLPAHVRARASYGPEAHAQAAYLACAHFVPVARAAELMRQLSGLGVSSGWMASVRGRAACLLTGSGFAGAVRDLLRQAPALHADETPARAAGGLRYVHLACTSYLTLMHTGDRSAQAVDAGGVLPGYDGILVRDGYHGGYAHLAGALHAWCGAHLLRDLRDVHDACPGEQEWAAKMGCLLLRARDLAAAARREGKPDIDPVLVSELTADYRAVAREGWYASIYRHGGAARQARGLARRFQRYEDMILRFVTRPDLDIFTNNEAERTIRCVKVQQRASGGCWRTLQGLADFAVVQSYLSTAAKWDISKLDALRALFNGNPWIPPAIQPSG